VPDLRSVVVAVGSGATMAGLVVAVGADRVLGVDTGAIPDPLPAVAGFASEMGGTLVTPAQLTVRRDQVGSGYGDYTAQAAKCMRFTFATTALAGTNP
jgi:D-cysteine desulfhydrase